jgi:DNA polymerase I-like protein with 3'-5' exonuclease and polymerase domains
MRLAGRYSLEAWGHRLGVYKGDFGKTSDWSEFTQEMLDYCVQDTLVNAYLWDHFAEKNYSAQAINLEQEFVKIMGQQERWGFLFDMEAARKLCAELQTRMVTLDAQLAEMIAPFVIEYETPKKKIKKTKTVLFNPASRDHIAKHLMDRRGWKPKQFTDGGGKAQVDEAVLDKLPKEWPEVAVLAERFMVSKRLAQLAEGKQGWMRLVAKDGRIHGRVNHNGAVTGRCTHSGPNMAQVPNGQAPYGPQCRALFTVAPGMKLVGADASGLELRCLAHYMAKYDGGEYAKVILEGDIHTVNQQAAGLATRDQAKTFIYAFLYGAGDEKIGSIVGKGAKAGKQLKEQFLSRTPALKRLREDILTAVRARPFLKGLDGRLLNVRHKHAALNTLLQGAGAVVMKQATILLRDSLADVGLGLGIDYCNVGHIHDEIQLEVPEADAQLVGELAVASIRHAGEVFNFRCRLDGAFKVGTTWAETH